MATLILFFLLCSHAPLLWACTRSVWHHRLPRSIDLIGVSFLLYFDIEIAFEAFGGYYQIPFNFFRPFFSASDWSLTWAFLALLAGPWLLKFGYWLVPKSDLPQRHRIAHPKFFYLASLTICSLIALWSLSKLIQFENIWDAHAAFAENFGLLAPLLYLPLGIFMFYLVQRESKTIRGKMYLGLLMLLSILSMLATGERTLVLLPLLLISMFYRRPSAQRIALIGTGLVVLSIVLLPLYRWNHKDSSNKEAAIGVFTTDLARGPELTYNIDNSKLIGTGILPYPGAGYVFAAMLYVPRSLAPWKGYSTARYLTAQITNETPDALDWGFGGGAIDELILNFGILFVFPGLVLYGIGFGLLDRLAHRFPVFGISSRLSAVWLLGYDLPALITLFGVIGVIGSLCQWIFTRRLQRFQFDVQVVRHLIRGI